MKWKFFFLWFTNFWFDSSKKELTKLKMRFDPKYYLCNNKIYENSCTGKLLVNVLMVGSLYFENARNSWTYRLNSKFKDTKNIFFIKRRKMQPTKPGMLLHFGRWIWKTVLGAHGSDAKSIKMKKAFNFPSGYSFDGWR